MKIYKPVMWLAALALSAIALCQSKAAVKAVQAKPIEGPLPITAVSAESAIIVEAESGKVLWQKNPDTSRFPASTTKIMTAMLLLEHCTPDEIIVAPPEIEKVTDASMHLKAGEKLTASDMLYALMLRSANDGCVAVACHIAGSVPKFVEMMNKRAKELGCTNTHFDNPNGLNDDKHTTTAHDLAIIARAAMRYPDFARAVRTYKHVIKRDPANKDTLMTNHDKYLVKDPTADGIKTGWTIPAGRCFVGSATRNGYRIITVVLKSTDWQKDHGAMLGWAFANHDRELVFKPNETLGPIPVQGGLYNQVGLQPASNPVHIWMKGVERNFQVKFDHPQFLAAPITKGQKVGQVICTDEDGFVQTVDLLATQDVPQSSAAHMIGRAESAPSFLLIGGCLGFGAYYMRVKSRRSTPVGKRGPVKL